MGEGGEGGKKTVSKTAQDFGKIRRKHKLESSQEEFSLHKRRAGRSLG